jgi:hypothetical protein
MGGHEGGAAGTERTRRVARAGEVVGQDQQARYSK